MESHFSGFFSPPFRFMERCPVESKIRNTVALSRRFVKRDDRKLHGNARINIRCGDNKVEPNAVPFNFSICTMNISPFEQAIIPEATFMQNCAERLYENLEKHWNFLVYHVGSMFFELFAGKRGRFPVSVPSALLAFRLHSALRVLSWRSLCNIHSCSLAVRCPNLFLGFGARTCVSSHIRDTLRVSKWVKDREGEGESEWDAYGTRSRFLELGCRATPTISYIS